MTKSVQIADNTYYYAAIASFGLAVTSAGVYLASKKPSKKATEAGDFLLI